MRPLPHNIRKAFKDLARTGIETRTFPLIVGGFVRDWILNGRFEDIDDFDCITRDGDTDILTRAFSERSGHQGGVTTYEYSGTTLVYNNGLKFEFQSDSNPHVHFDIVPDMQAMGIPVTPLTKNIYERDFTINTLCYDVIKNKVVDVTGYGVNDIWEERLLRTPITAERAIVNNPFILLRMVRFQIQYNLELDKELAVALPNGINILKSRLNERSEKFIRKVVSGAFNLDQNKADELYRRYGLYDVVPDKYIPKKFQRTRLFNQLDRDFQANHGEQNQVENS